MRGNVTPVTFQKVKIRVLLPFLALIATAFADSYEEYVKSSPDFRPVKQDPAMLLAAFPSWTYMPWTYQWHIGYTEDSGKWTRATGYNGAFIDRDDISGNGSPTGKLDWINEFKLRFYVDHAADKGLLHLWDGNAVKPHLNELHSTGIRPVPLNAGTLAILKKHLEKNIAAVKSSPYRAAYAFDDEPSWGHFVHPTMWRITDDNSAFQKFLNDIYGGNPPERPAWISYEDLRGKLPSWNISTFDASPLMDQWTFNDTLWANTLGTLTEYANTLDPATPCGIVGGQCPSPFGGYDYARLMRKIQFIEAYNLGSSQSLIRSFNLGNAIPAVTTHFHQSSDDDIWQIWYYLAQGNRGHIGWVEKWFDGKTPKPFHQEISHTLKEAGEKIGPLMSGARWIHDGVALYYNHPSVQLGWILDAEAHGKTWTNRNDDHRLSSSVLVRKAWENMLRDSGIQFNYLSYIDTIQHGIPAEYKVLILPATLCLSDAEARRIREFCEKGGTVIADYLPGVWDQHGKGRGKGVLDDMFGITHPSHLGPRDIFGETLWCETDQDANYSWKSYRELLTNKNTSLLSESGFHIAVRNLPIGHSNDFGKGKAILMNLSPQFYNVYRSESAAASKKRETFLKPITAAGARPSVRLKNAGEKEHGYEITLWQKPASGKDPARKILFLIQNPETTGNALGGGNSSGLKTATLPVTFQFSKPITKLRDERTGKVFGDGKEFSLDWKQNEAVVLSYSDAHFPGK